MNQLIDPDEILKMADALREKFAEQMEFIRQEPRLQEYLAKHITNQELQDRARIEVDRLLQSYDSLPAEPKPLKLSRLVSFKKLKI